jgi:hypothetical protein
VPKATVNSGWYYEEDEAGEFESLGFSYSASAKKRERNGNESGPNHLSHAHDVANPSDPVTSLPPDGVLSTDGRILGTSSDQPDPLTSGETSEGAQARDEKADELMKTRKQDPQEQVAAADEAEMLRPDLEEKADDKRQTATRRNNRTRK